VDRGRQAVVTAVRWGALVVATVACKAGSHDRSAAARRESADPLDRAMALRDDAPAGAPSWREGTRWLATDRTFGEAAVDHDKELIASAGDAIVRVPKDGTPPSIIVTTAGRIEALAVTSASLVYTAFTSRGNGSASHDGDLYAVPLAGGQPTRLRGVGISDEVVAAGPALWLAHERQVLASREPTLAELAVIADKPRYTAAIAADSRGVWWVEAEYDKAKMKDGDWLVTPERRVQVPVRFILDSLASDGRRLVALGEPSNPTTSNARTTPDGDTYYESSIGIYALAGDGGVQPIADSLGEVRSFALAGASICAVDDGPKLEFGKRTKVIAVASDGSRRVTTLATGLAHARVIAADATSCYVTVAGTKGIAVVPLPR
jgi:hypothetical protein